MPDSRPSRPGVVLLSGGLDSATVLAIARDRAFDAHTLSIDYGQRHRCELDAAERVARALGARTHRVVRLDLRAVGGSALTDDTIDVPKSDDISPGIPVTYVPARNLALLSIALGLAETLNARDLFVGVNAVDYSGYPDCRPAFIEAFERTANLATRLGVEAAERGEAAPFRVHAPLIEMSKADIVRTGVSLGVDYAMTVTCYDPDGDGLACARCDACRLRARGFADAALPDPTRYQAGARP
ncbi:MAG: 7-cyano-7-deazaguanine synthase QueC [Phycisphaerales bacterium]|nr:MAG: 7-cyano-7-deazaguanine synthase QueC [Phycisphaerales bacterium]